MQSKCDRARKRCFPDRFKRPQPPCRSWSSVSSQHHCQSQSQSSCRYLPTSVRYCRRGAIRRLGRRPLPMLTKARVHSKSGQPTPPATEANNDRGTYSFIRKMMALPFLPESEIQPMFQRLQCQASEPLQPFAEYVSSTWIHGTTWVPSDWSVFKKAVRTNNDVEGWHHGLNR